MPGTNLRKGFSDSSKGRLCSKLQDQTQTLSLDSWFRFNQNLRNELAWARALRAGKDPLLHIRGSRAYEPLFIDVVAQAAKAPDPLASEKLLDRFRWQCLDGLLYGHYFDIEVLLVYAFKLQILERYQEIESSKGQEIFAEYKKLEMPDF